MLSEEDNEFACRVGPGTPMGELFRRFWLPAMLADELPKADCPPVRLRLLGEDLVGFRDTNDKIAVVEAHCPHRGASLYFGRNEECGIRCVYHGWKFDVDGNCVDMPSEPPESNFKDKIRITSYPTALHGGLIWVYMGPAHLRAELPQLEWGSEEDRRGQTFMTRLFVFAFDLTADDFVQYRLEQAQRTAGNQMGAAAAR